MCRLMPINIQSLHDLMVKYLVFTEDKTKYFDWNCEIAIRGPISP